MRFLRRNQPPPDEADVAALLEALEPRVERLFTSPTGEPLQRPGWAVRPMLKMELAEMLGLMDDVYDKTPASLVSQELSPKTLIQTEKVYDRVFKAHGMTDLVQEVLRRLPLQGGDEAADKEDNRDAG